MEKLTTLTIEFRLDRRMLPDHWLDIASQIWNDGLDLLNWRQQYLRREECISAQTLGADYSDWGSGLLPPAQIDKRRDEVTGQYSMVCWISSCQRKDRSLSFEADNIEDRPTVKLLKRPEWATTPPIDGRSPFELAGRFTKKIGYDYGDLPSGMVQFLIGTLARSWGEYVKSGAGKPKYKGKKNKLSSLGYGGFRHHCKIDGDKVKLLGLDAIVVSGLSRRLGSKIEKTAEYLQQNPTDRVLKRAEKSTLAEAAAFYAIPGLYRIVRRENADYLQIAGEFAVDVPAAKERSIVIEVGGNGGVLYSASNANIIQSHDIGHLDDRITALQRQLAKKTYQSKNWRKLKSRISALQRRKAESKRKHQQYHSQWLTDRYGTIDVEKIKQQKDTVPVPIPDGMGGYLPNGRSIVRVQNKNADDLSGGQFVAILEQQAAKRGTIVKAIKPTPATNKRHRRKERVVKTFEAQASPPSEGKQPKSLNKPHG